MVRVGGEEATDVGPVLVDRGVQAAGHDGAGDVAAATLEELDGAVDRRAVEAGQHEAAQAHGGVLQANLGALHVDGTVVMEHHHVGGVEEGHPQVLGHEARGKPLAAAHDVLGREALDDRRELLELRANGVLHAQLLGDLDEAVLDVLEQRGAVHVVGNVGVDQKQQVGDLVVLVKALARRGNHHVEAVGVGAHDVADLLELPRVSDAGASKLCNLNHV